MYDDFAHISRPAPRDGDPPARRRLRLRNAPPAEVPERRRVRLRSEEPKPERDDRRSLQRAARRASALAPGAAPAAAGGAAAAAPGAAGPPRAAAASEPAEVHELRPPRRGRVRGGGAGGGGATAGTARGWFLADEPDRRRRGIWLLLAFGAMACAISARLVDVQVLQSGWLSAAAQRQHVATVPLHAHRGRILDRNGRLLASDLPLYAVYADPGVIPPEDRHNDAMLLAPILGIGTSKLDDMLNQTGDYVPLAHGVTEGQRKQLADLAIYGIIATVEDQRVYETSALGSTTLASNLLGYVDHDGHGQYGVEAYYNKVLSGQDGQDSTIRDLGGNPIVLGSAQHQDARDGRDLVLGLDSRIQYYAEQAIAQAVQSSGAESGSVLIMDTQTGSIRGWADFPSYSANSFAGANPGAIRDLSIGGFYEPGSVMKVVTFAGGLDHHVITPDEHINEHETVINGFRIHDWDGRSSHPNITFQWVLDDSLNNGAIAVQQRLSHDDFYTNLLRFGIGTPTGVDLAGEQYPQLRPEATWSDVDYATASFGQQVQVTPIEMLAAINAVGNGGEWVSPHAVDAVVDPATGQQTAVSPTARRVMAPDTATTLAKMMTGVVEDRGASGYLARIPAFKNAISGKTGTASVPENGRYGNDVISSFVGFLPLGHPKFTMLVVVRKPQHCVDEHNHRQECEGAYVAAPVFRQLAQLMIDDWKIEP